MAENTNPVTAADFGKHRNTDKEPSVRGGIQGKAEDALAYMFDKANYDSDPKAQVFQDKLYATIRDACYESVLDALAEAGLIPSK